MGAKSVLFGFNSNVISSVVVDVTVTSGDLGGATHEHNKTTSFVYSNKMNCCTSNDQFMCNRIIAKSVSSKTSVIVGILSNNTFNDECSVGQNLQSFIRNDVIAIDLIF